MSTDKTDSYNERTTTGKPFVPNQPAPHQPAVPNHPNQPAPNQPDKSADPQPKSVEWNGDTNAREEGILEEQEQKKKELDKNNKPNEGK